MRYLFDPATRASAVNLARFEESEAFKHQDIGTIYTELLRRCKPFSGDIAPALHAGGIGQLVPRGLDPSGGASLGTVTSPSTAD